VVAAEKKDAIWVFYFEGEEKADCLNSLASPIYIISKEEVGCLWGESSVFKEAQHVVVLAVDIPTDLDWSVDLY